jgi:TRAP-type C4-dicarboxylate transport system substrate-binding protein
MSWDEVAPNVVIDQLWACGGNFTVNLDFWNGLSEAQQSIIKEAAMRTGEYSLKMNADEEADQIAAIEARSNTTVKYLSDEDAATFFGYVFDTNADNSLNRVAGDAEKTANMTMILETVADYYGYDWEH